MSTSKAKSITIIQHVCLGIEVITIVLVAFSLTPHSGAISYNFAAICCWVAGLICLILSVFTLLKGTNRSYSIATIVLAVLIMTAPFWLAFIGFALSNHPA